MGMKLLVHNAEHLRCSTIEKWYPEIKDKTPFTKIYEKFPDVDELLKDFSFPVFIKGNRQTGRHNKSQCIIENAEDYEQLKRVWKNDSILSWQKVAVREYVKLQTIDDTSYPEMVPISYEFRFFCFEGKCVGYGLYWYMGNKYAMSSEDEKAAIELSEWAAHRVATCFIAVDLAKTDAGEWIIIGVKEFLPEGADPELFTMESASAGDGVAISGYARDKLDISVECVNDFPEDSWVDLPLVYYPGYVAVDRQGRELEVVCSEQYTVQVILPGYYEGKIDVSFRDPVTWTVSFWISICSAVLLTGYAVIGGIWRKRRDLE